MLTAMSFVEAPGAVIVNDVNWLHRISPRPSPRAEALEGSVTRNWKGFPNHTKKHPFTNIMIQKMCQGQLHIAKLPVVSKSTFNRFEIKFCYAESCFDFKVKSL